MCYCRPSLEDRKMKMRSNGPFFHIACSDFSLYCHKLYVSIKQQNGDNIKTFIKGADHIVGYIDIRGGVDVTFSS